MRSSSCPSPWLPFVTAPPRACQHVRETRMVYHSELPSEDEPHACGFALLPLNSRARGPARRVEGAQASRPAWLLLTSRRQRRGGRGAGILQSQRAAPKVRRERCVVRRRTSLLKPLASQPFPGSSDRLLIYLTLYISACLRKLESAPTAAAGHKVEAPALASRPAVLRVFVGTAQPGHGVVCNTRRRAVAAGRPLQPPSQQGGGRRVKGRLPGPVLAHAALQTRCAPTCAR